MGRKKGKRQGDPSRDDVESTDTERGGEGEEEGVHVSGQSSCPHVAKAVQLNNIKKSLKVAWVRVGQCQHCFKDQQAKSPQSIQLKRVKNEVLRREHMGKVSAQEIKKMQLERAKEEQKAAAEKLKQLREVKTEPEPVAPSDKRDDGDKAEETKSVGGKASSENPVNCVSNCWLCMKCGSQGCDDANKKHSLGHYKAPRSDLHCLIVNTDNFSIWCYECNTQINVDTHKKLFEVVELVKKIRDKPATTDNVKPAMMSPLGAALIQYSSPSSNLKSNAQTPVSKTTPKTCSTSSPAVTLPRVKGLSNLGNTCFFNSVMQCLAQTHVLTRMMEDHVQQGAVFSIQGSNLAVDDSSESESSVSVKMLDVFSDVSVKMEASGPMMTTLSAFFRDMLGGGKSSVLNPGSMFSQVSRQCPKFRGMQQQDSHELLRYLLDGLRTEETKRQKAAVLKYFGLTEKSDPKNVPNHLKHKLQAYGRETNHCLLDRVFSGQMVSSIVCEVCHHSSVTYEHFLDLSIPILDMKPLKPQKSSSAKQKLSNAVNTEDDDGFAPIVNGAQTKKKGKMSKRQMKKEKIKLRKEHRRNRKNSVKSESENVQDKNEVEKEDVREDQEESRDEDKSEGQEDENVESASPQDNEEVKAEGAWEWDYGEPWEDKQMLVFRTARDSTEDTSDDTSDNLIAVQLVSVKCLDEDQPETVSSNCSSSVSDPEEKGEDDSGSSSNGDVEDNDNEEDKMVKRRLDSILVTGDNCDPALVEVCRRMSSVRLSDCLNQKERQMKEWTGRTLTTLAPRHVSSIDGDTTSLYSCLNMFTQTELLAGHNKWACDSCTRIKNDTGQTSDCSSSGKSGQVYSNAYKQFLIFCPPAILTLHLKRFQQTLSGCKKVNKPVSFPLVLDLAPYCSSTSVAMSNISADQSQVLYSLYGVVEHSGGLHGGHYTAFVKVRSQDSNMDVDKFFAPPLTKTSDIPRLLESLRGKLSSYEHCMVNGDHSSAPKQEGVKRWFHISDSCVSEVSEERVLKCQAYLLFYERSIWFDDQPHVLPCRQPRCLMPTMCCDIHYCQL